MERKLLHVFMHEGKLHGVYEDVVFKARVLYKETDRYKLTLEREDGRRVDLANMRLPEIRRALRRLGEL